MFKLSFLRSKEKARKKFSLGTDSRVVCRDDFIIKIKPRFGKQFFISGTFKNRIFSTPYANIYKAHKINDNGEIDVNKLFVVKLIKKSSNLNLQVITNEVECANKCYPAYHVKIDNKSAIIMPFFAGQDLLENITNETVKDLSFQERIHLIAALCDIICRLHNNSPKNHDAWMHLDIKCENIMPNFFWDKEIEFFSNKAEIIDFNQSIKLENGNDLTAIAKCLGTVGYAAPEIFKELVAGPKSDVYSFTAVIMAILGAINPIYEKKNFDINSPDFHKKYKETEFDSFGIFLDCNIPEFKIDLKFLILNFLDKMQFAEYNERPDSGEVLRFFVTLNKLCLVKKYGTLEDEDEHTYLTKLILISEGLWAKYANFDFEGNPEKCRELIERFKNFLTDFCENSLEQFLIDV